MRLNSVESYIEYRLPETLTDGEFSVLITNMGNTNDPFKSKVMSMLQGDGVNITDNAYRLTLDRRNADAGCGEVRYTLRSRGVDAGEPRGGCWSWTRSKVYLWTYTWRTIGDRLGQSNLKVRDGGLLSGTLFKDFGPTYRAPYEPRPHIIRLGSVLGRGGSESLPGATFRNLWVSPNPRPTTFPMDN
jgi:hypothetical protein